MVVAVFVVARVVGVLFFGIAWTADETVIRHRLQAADVRDRPKDDQEDREHLCDPHLHQASGKSTNHHVESSTPTEHGASLWVGVRAST